ncbi:MAG: succinate dehydrogenase, hydrophobic membrane anchor protein [Alphaproteobacteria bacterium]
MTDKFETKLGRVRGLGSAKDGTHHWWIQRVTAIALIPLTLWFMYSVISGMTSSYETLLFWLQQPWNATLAVLLIISGLYHAQLGMQVVYEDYIGNECVRKSVIVASKFVFIVFGVSAVLSIIKVYMQGG